MNSVAIWLNNKNKFAVLSSTLTRWLKPQVMYFMIIAFVEILINICLSVNPRTSDGLNLEVLELKTGDFVQLILAGCLGLAALAFFLFQLFFAVYKSRLLAKIGQITPSESSEAYHVMDLLRAYRLSIHLKEKEARERQR